MEIKSDIQQLDELLQDSCKTIEVDDEKTDNLMYFKDSSIDDNLVTESLVIEQDKKQEQ